MQYVYDELGRLTAVVDQQGNVATYAYDAVGNLRRIERVNTDDLSPVQITLVSPGRGLTGTPVTIFGKGFSPDPAANTVRFNGTPATVTAAAANSLVTYVPGGATTGRITVTNQQGSATSPSDFTVGGTLSVTPTAAALVVGQAVQFQAAEGGSPTSNVTWAVNGITGGVPSIGTITPDGLYTAPAWIPPGALGTTVVVTTTLRDDRTASATATLTLINPSTVASAAGGVSVRVIDGQTFVVSTDGGVSVQVVDGTTFVAGPAVAVTRVPVITAITPSSGRRSTTTSVTLTGAGFTGATGLSVVPTGNLTFSNLQVSGDDTATAQITAGAATGVWAIQISTPSGASTRDGTGSNLFTVTP